MSNFDDIKKKIQILKNKKPENNILDNLSKIEMEINKDTLLQFKKNNETQKQVVSLASEYTIDNNNTNFLTTSLFAQNQSFLDKTAAKKESLNNGDPNNFLLNLNLSKDKESLFKVANIDENYEKIAKEIDINPKNVYDNMNTNNEGYNKFNSEDLIYKNNIINYQGINNNLNNKKLSNNEVNKEIQNKISTNQEKSSILNKRELSSNVISNNNSRLEEMRKLFESKSTDKEKF